MRHRAPPLEPGLDNIKRFYRGYWAAFPDIRLGLGPVIADAGRVSCVFEVRATHQGPIFGLPASGRPVRFGGVTLLRFEDGKCIERWSQTDLMSLRRQIELG